MWDSEYFQTRGLPPPGQGFLRQLLHGLCLPLHLARVLFRDPGAKRRYLRVCTAQFAVIVGLGLVFMKSGQEVADDVQDRAEKAALAKEEASSEDAIQKLLRELMSAESAAEGPQPRKQDDTALERAKADTRAAVKRARAATVETQARTVLLKMAQKQGKPEEALARLGAEVQKAEARAADARAEADAARARLRQAADASRMQARHEKQARVHFQEFTVMDLEFWVALLAAMHIVQWLVIALSRDYHDAIARDVSLLTGLEPEDGPLEPRVRLNTPWLRKKLKRRWRALVLFFMAMPVLWVVTALLPLRGVLLSALTSAWAVWWFVVFAAGKSARAWAGEATAGPPWFLRFWTWLTTRVPGFRWSLPRRYGAFLENQARSVYSPAACVEQQPGVFAGLALARTLTLVPGVKCFIRPLIPVASAHLLEAWKAAHPAAPPQAPAEAPAPASATS